MAIGAISPQTIFQGLLQRGLSAPQAYAALGNWKQESELNPGAWNPTEGAGGLDQWRGTRLQSLQALGTQEGKDWRDPNVQMDFFVKELPTQPGGNAFLNARSIPDANAALKKYIRYGSPPDKGGEITRLQYANQFAGMPMNSGASSASSPLLAATAPQGAPQASASPLTGLSAQNIPASALALANGTTGQQSSNPYASLLGSMTPQVQPIQPPQVPQQSGNSGNALLAFLQALKGQAA